MRGSPLVRFLILVLALAAAGVGLLRVTSARSVVEPLEQPAETRITTLSQIPYRLLLSAPAESVKLDTGTASVAGLSSGLLELDPLNPRVGVVVRWKNPPAAGEHRFAKLTLEPPGQDTLVHVFDADGDIDDLFELPLPAENHE